VRAPHAAFRDAVIALLDPVGPSVFDERGRATMGKSPRWAWKTTGAEAFTSKRPAINGGTMELNGTDSYAFEVECWGADEDGAWCMRLALISAVRDIASASFKLGATRVSEPPVVDDGYQVTVAFTVQIARPEITLPTEADSGVEALEAATIEDTDIESVTFDDSDALPEDGVLTLGDDEPETEEEIP
jgi:hypothetical protein